MPTLQLDLTSQDLIRVTLIFLNHTQPCPTQPKLSEPNLPAQLT